MRQREASVEEEFFNTFSVASVLAKRLFSVRAKRPDSDSSNIVMWPTSSTYERNLVESLGRTLFATTLDISVPSRSLVVL